MNNENLIPLTERSEEEARKIRSMGGKARAKKAREMKYKRLYAQMILEALEDEEFEKEILEQMETHPDALWLKKRARKRGKNNKRTKSEQRENESNRRERSRDKAVTNESKRERSERILII